MLTTRMPATWQELQTETARVLRECGMTVEVEKQVVLPRGSAKIDVYAEETVHGRPYSIICECKYWKNPVPQTIAHAFRTVMGEIGANKGYIISTSRFQSGTIEAVQSTNVELVTWPQFLDAFEASWLERFFTPQITERLLDMTIYCEPLLPFWLKELPEDAQDRFIALRDRHIYFGNLVMRFTTYAHMAMGEAKWPPLPLRVQTLPEACYLPDDVLDARGYRELFETIMRRGEAITAEFEAIPGVARNRGKP